jgi:hypothetical protein
VPEQPATPDVRDWRDLVDWWADPRLAYAAGLADGAALERARADLEADAGQRAAARRASVVIQQGNARAIADRPGPRPGDHPGHARTQRPERAA